MRYLLVFLLAICPAALAQTGTLALEKSDQIGVFEVQVSSGQLKPGDIVAITRAGKKLGEATVMSSQGNRATVSLKGVFEAKTGDTVQFARSAAAPAAAPAASNPQPSGDRPVSNSSAPRNPRPQAGPPQGNSSNQRRPTSQRCPSCQGLLYTTGKTVIEKGRPSQEYVCDSGHSWVKAKATSLGNGRYMCPTCSMPVQVKSSQPMVRDKKVVRCPAGHTFSITR